MMKRETCMDNSAVSNMVGKLALRKYTLKVIEPPFFTSRDLNP